MSNTSLCDSENDDNFQVFARIRPPTPREVNIVEGFQSPRPDIKYSSEHFPIYNSIDPPSCLLKTNDNLIYLTDPLSSRRDQPFVFDAVFHEKKSNLDVFQKCVKPNLENLFQGYNTTFFAYGNTGSGKTHTIFGGHEEQGIYLMAFKEILERTKLIKSQTFFMNFSYLEIYNENVRDLISETQKSLSLVEDPVKGVYVPELKQNPVYNFEQMEHQINIGNQKRALAATFSNQYSSRSHAILQLVIEANNMKKNQGLEENFISKLTIVDLAGSEKAFTSLDNKSKGILEGSNINKSLLALGNCINILSEKNKKGCHVPYRDSKLTRLLKDSLGGNTKTIMIACISPSLVCMEETLNTLNYAKRARNIKKKVFKNIKENNEESENVKYQEKIQNLLQQVDFQNKIINQQSICQVCKKLSKENKELRNSDLPKEEYQFPQSLNKVFSEEVFAVYKTKNDKFMIEKQDLTKSLKKMEIQLSDLNQSNDKNNNDNNSEYFKRICCDVMANIEENFEIKQSLKELDDLILQYNTNLNLMSERLGNIDDHIYEMDELEEEIAITKRNNLENIEIKNKLLSALNINKTQKNILFELMFKMTDDNKAILLEKDILSKKKQLENIDILLQNNEIMKELHLKDKIILEKEEIINSLKLNFKDSKPLLTNFEYSPITDKMQNDNNQKRINSTTLSSKKLLAPPQVEPQKYYGPPSYLSSKSPKNDLSKKNKSDCYANNEEHQKESGVNIYEMRNTVKKVETLKNYKTFNQESFKSPYKIGFPSEKSNLSKSKINKENVHPSEFQASNHDFEKMNISEYLQINKNPKKIPITATIELFKLTEDKKNEEAITPKPILKNSSLEKSKKGRTTSSSQRYDADLNHADNVDLKEFTLNIEDTQRFNPVEETEKILRKTDDGYFQDSTNFKNENPLLSQSLKKIEKSNEKHPEHNKVKQSFEDFKNKFMAQTKINESPISYVNFLKSTCQDDSEKKRNDKDQLVPSKFFETGYKNFDSASKNPLESESENDNTEKNLVGSPIIQKSSRNYYTNAKVLRNHH